MCKDCLCFLTVEQTALINFRKLYQFVAELCNILRDNISANAKSKEVPSIREINKDDFC